VLELNTAVARALLPSMGIDTGLAPNSKIHWLPATFHNSRWMDHCEVCHGSIEAISILNPVDVEEAYSHIASHCHSVQSHVRSYGRHDASLAQKKTPWMEELFFTVKLARQKLSKFYAEVTRTTGMPLISAHILDPIRMLQSFRKWDKGMDINPEDEISHTTQYHEAFLKFVENEYCGKHQHVPVNTLESLPCSKLAPSALASESCQSSSDPDDLWSDNWDYSTPKDVAETTPGWSYHAACLLTAARLYWNSPPEAPNNWGRINPNLDDYHYDPIQISSTFWLQDITDWWHQQEEMHSKYANLSNVARDIFSIISHVVGVEASFTLGKMSLAAGSQKPEARSFTKNSV